MADKKNNTGTDNTGANNTGSGNSGNRNSGDGNSGSGNSGYWNSGYGNSGSGNSGYWNSGSGNSGYWNSGNGNSGAFNTDEPYARLFNNQGDVRMSELLSSDRWPSFYEFDLCAWVDESIMTDEEKEKYPTYKTTGGYLKTLEYKQAWAVFWRKTDEANRRKFLALPNFCPKIFKEITGIDVEGSEAKQKATELRQKADELLRQATELENSL